MEKVHSIVLGWPALMKLETASQYLSLDNLTFEFVANRYSVFPAVINDDQNRWRKTDLDKLIKRLPNNMEFESPTPEKRVLNLDKRSLEELALKIGDQLKNAKAGKTSSLVSISETASFLGVGRSTVYRLIDNGQLKKRKIGRRTLITRGSINLLLDQ